MSLIMKKIHVFLIVVLFGFFMNKGTIAEDKNPVVVKVFVSEDGVPEVDVDIIVAETGQKIIFNGPAKFTIRFPKGAPFEKEFFMIENGTLSLVVQKQNKNKKQKQKNIKGKRDKFIKETMYKYRLIIDKAEIEKDMIIKHYRRCFFCKH